MQPLPEPLRSSPAAAAASSAEPVVPELAAGPAPSAERGPAVIPPLANRGFEPNPTPAPLHSPSEADSENEAPG